MGSKTIEINHAAKSVIDIWKARLVWFIAVPVLVTMTVLGFTVGDPVAAIGYSLGGVGWCLFVMEYMYRHHVDFEVTE